MVEVQTTLARDSSGMNDVKGQEGNLHSFLGMSQSYVRLVR